MDLSKEIKHGFDFTEVKVVTMVKIDLPQELLQLKKKKKQYRTGLNSKNKMKCQCIAKEQFG